MRIVIDTIAHVHQRYPTVGDWQFSQDGSRLGINISRMDNEDYEFLVALHEMIEAYLCRKHGITTQQVDEFDMNYEANRINGDESEPGAQPVAPYFKEHQAAENIERHVAVLLGVDWDTYDKHVEAL